MGQIVNIHPVKDLELGNEGVFCIDSERNIARSPKAHARETAGIVGLRQGKLIRDECASDGVPRASLHAENLLPGLSIYILQTDAAAALSCARGGNTTSIVWIRGVRNEVIDPRGVRPLLAKVLEL